MNRIKLFALSIIVLAAAAFGLSSCSEGSESGADAQELEKLGDVQAVVREEGSGTRDVFEEATGITAKAEGEDRLRDDILEAASSDEVISLVEENVSAIGYVSRAGIDDDEAVKAVSIDGTAPDSSSIQSGDYELTRTFYLAYSGELNDLEKDFMSYVKGVGQNTVAEDYIAAGETGEDVFLSGKIGILNDRVEKLCYLVFQYSNSLSDDRLAVFIFAVPAFCIFSGIVGSVNQPVAAFGTSDGIYHFFVF